MLLIILFGVLSGSLLSVLVGFIGSNRRIGFGWSFILSLIFTPLVGLIFTLLSDPLPYGSGGKWGCVATLCGILGFLMLIPIILMLLGLGMFAAL